MPQSMRKFAQEAYEHEDEEVICSTCRLDEDLQPLIEDVLTGTPFEGNIESVTPNDDLTPFIENIDDAIYHGSEFEIHTKDGDVHFAEILLTEEGIVFYFQDQEQARKVWEEENATTQEEIAKHVNPPRPIGRKK